MNKGTGGSPTLDTILQIRPQRANTYGSCEKGFGTIGALWDAYLAGRPGGKDMPITAIDVAVMISLMKIGRISTGTAHHDNFADGANYLVLAGDLSFPAEEK